MVNTFNELLLFKKTIEGTLLTNVYYNNVFFEDETPFKESLFHDVPYDIILDFNGNIFYKLTLENFYIQSEIGLSKIMFENFPNSKIREPIWDRFSHKTLVQVSFLLEDDKRNNIFEDILLGKQYNLQNVFFAGIKFLFSNGHFFYVYSAECLESLNGDYHFSRPATVFAIFFEKEEGKVYENLPFFK